jgi:hypothetical protein
MDVEEYTELAVYQAAITLQWQAADVSEDGGNGYPTTDGGDEYTDAVAAIPDLIAAVTAFVADNWETLSRANVEAGQCGHDFILTANGHGAGFWDRGLGGAGKTLTDACRGYSFDAEFMLWGDRADGDEHCSDEVGFLMVENTVIVDDMGICEE